MIRARLRPTEIQPEVSLQAYRTLIQSGRTEIAQERLRSRNKSLSYARFIRKKAFSKGYLEGLAAAQNDYAQAMQALRLRYSTILDAAKEDTRALAYLLVERLIDMSALENPAILEAWIHQGLETLKQTRNLVIAYHPRYERMMSFLASRLPQGISTRSDKNIQDVDFLIRGEAGGVEFSWRSALRESTLGAP